MTDAVVNVANVLHCAARTNLTMTEANVMRLVFELTGRLNSLVRELSTAVSTLDPLDLCARQFVHLPGLKGNNFSSSCRTSARWRQTFGRFLQRRILRRCPRNT